MNSIKQNTTLKYERLQSLDILRGFDMFWIIGGSTLVITLAKYDSLSWLQPLAEQMHHVSWEGFRFMDLIFPLFMFISGVAIPYAIGSKIDKGISKSLLQWKIIKRGLILVLFGILYNGALQKGFENLRYASVLGQIGLAYLFAATIFLHTKSIKARVLWLLGILLIITFLQLFIPVPEHGYGYLLPDRGINAWLDQLLLPGRLHGETYDPEGILCIVSATTVTLMGALTGSLLKTGSYSQLRKSLMLLISGVFLIILAVLLSPFYPVIKKVWTVTFNLLTAGISAVLLSIFYYFTDVKKCSGRICCKVSFFFKVIGLNSITIYMASRIIPFKNISMFFTGWLATYFGEWIIVIGIIFIEWILLYYLYRKNVFLRV